MNEASTVHILCLQELEKCNTMYYFFLQMRWYWISSNLWTDLGMLSPLVGTVVWVGWHFQLIFAKPQLRGSYPKHIASITALYKSICFCFKKRSDLIPARSGSGLHQVHFDFSSCFKARTLIQRFGVIYVEPDTVLM